MSELSGKTLDRLSGFRARLREFFRDPATGKRLDAVFESTDIQNWKQALGNVTVSEGRESVEMIQAGMIQLATGIGYLLQADMSNVPEESIEALERAMFRARGAYAEQIGPHRRS